MWMRLLLNYHQRWLLASSAASHLENEPFFRPLGYGCVLDIYCMGHIGIETLEALTDVYMKF